MQIDSAVSLDELNQKEKFWIGSLKTIAPDGYNQTIGGEGVAGRKHTEASKALMSQKMKGRPSPMKGKPGYPKSEETLRKMSASMKGKNKGNKHPHLAEWNRQHRGPLAPNYGKGKNWVVHPFLGKRHTEETKEKLRQISTGKKYSPEVGQKKSKSLLASWATITPEDKAQRVSGLARYWDTPEGEALRRDKIHSAENRHARSESMKSRQASLNTPEIRAKRREAQKLYWSSPEARAAQSKRIFEAKARKKEATA